MPQPSAYERVFSFTDYTANHPADQQPGVRLDTEFDAIATTTDEIRENLALLQRDDGALANGVVTEDSLAPALLTGLRAVANSGDFSEDDLGDLVDARIAAAGVPLETEANVYTEGQTISAGSATTAETYLDLKPTDFAAGKPALRLKKAATANTWQLHLDDGAAGTGFILDIIAPSGFAKINGSPIYHTGNLSPVDAADLTAAEKRIARARRLAFCL